MAQYPTQGESPWGDKLKAYVDEARTQSVDAAARAEAAAADAEQITGLTGEDAVVGALLRTDGSESHAALVEESEIAAVGALTENPSVINQAATQAGAAAAASATSAVTLAGVSDTYSTPPTTPTVVLGTLNPTASSASAGRRVIIATASTHKLTQPSVLRSMSARVSNDEASRTVEFYVFRPNGSGGYTVLHRSGAQAAPTAGTYTWTPAQYLRLQPNDVPGVWTGTNIQVNGVYWAQGAAGIGSIVYSAAQNLPAPAVGDIITPGAGGAQAYTDYIPAITWTTASEALTVATRWANQPYGYPRLDANGKIPGTLLSGSYWSGKRALVLGTSITVGANASFLPDGITRDGFIYQSLVKDHGMVVDNQAVGSSGIVWNGTRALSLGATQAELTAAGFVAAQSYEVKVLARPKPDIIIFDHLYNDRTETLGAVGDTTAASYYGAYNRVLTAAITQWPDVPILLIASHTSWAPQNEGDHPATRARRDALKIIADKYGTSWLDMLDRLNINNINKSNTGILPDGVHPSDLVHGRMRRLLSGAMASI